MLTHITVELPQVITEAGLPIVSTAISWFAGGAQPGQSQNSHRLSTRQDFSRQSIFGHSMGGHGALTIYLNSLRSGAKQYRSCSAFSPIANPTNCPWGQIAFKGYLQGGLEEGKEHYDATELIGKMGKVPVHILVDYVSLGCRMGSVASLVTTQFAQGTADNFYIKKQLLPENFLKAARDAGYDEVQVRVRSQEGYDHSYYFVRAPLRIWSGHRVAEFAHIDVYIRLRPYSLYVACSLCVAIPSDHACVQSTLTSSRHDEHTSFYV